MMKVFICPQCGWVRTVSRRKHVECYKCENREMLQAKVSFMDYSKMSEQQRNDYVESWMFLHAAGHNTVK